MNIVVTKDRKMHSRSSINFCFSFISFGFFFLYFFSQIDFSKSFLVYFTFFLIGLGSLCFLCFKESFLSWSKIFFSFIFIFFCIAPLSQYNSSVSLWNHTYFTNQDYIQCNILILLSISIFYIFYNLRVFKVRKGTICTVNHNVLFVFTFLNILVLVYCFLTNSIIGSEYLSSNSFASFFSKAIRFFPVANFLLYLLCGRKNIKKDSSYIIPTIIVISILYFPLSGSLARFMLFGAYLILFYQLLNRIKIHSLLPFLLIIGFFVVFPAFNFFKSFTIYELDKFTFNINGITNTVDFDSYQLFMESIKMAKANGILYGQNLLSGFLFFIPRSIWNSKLNYSGMIIAQFYGASFTNLSCPFIAEFYLGFGIFGVIIFSALLGLLFKLGDVFISTNRAFGKGISIIYCSLLFYTLRGSLLPTLSFTSSLALSYVIAFIILKIVLRTFNKKANNVSQTLI